MALNFSVLSGVSVPCHVDHNRVHTVLNTATI